MWMSIPFLSLATAGYGVGIALAAVALFRRSGAARRGASWLFVLTWSAHLAAVLQEGARTQAFPLANLAQYLMMLGWVVMSLHLWVWFRMRIDVAGLVLPTVAALASLGALETRGSTPAGGHDMWFVFHVSVSTLGMALLCVAFAMSILYLLQDRALKDRKTLRLLERLPALEKCDRIGFRALVTGFLLLTLGIGTGVLVNAEMHQRFWVSGVKQIAPLLAWVVFAGILVSRFALGYRGRTSAYLTIAGFALGLLTVLGMAT